MERLSRSKTARTPYPLSLGRIEGDHIVSGYTGFVYDAKGFASTCRRRAKSRLVLAYSRSPCMKTAFSCGPGWVNPRWLPCVRRPSPRRSTTRAGRPSAMNGRPKLTCCFSTRTSPHHPCRSRRLYIAPPVLRSSPPPLEVEVTETTVSFSRTYEPASIPAWQAELLGLPADAEHIQREQGAFVTPGLWVDRWDVHVDSEPNDTKIHTFRFTHAVTPSLQAEPGTRGGEPKLRAR